MKLTFVAAALALVATASAMIIEPIAAEPLEARAACVAKSKGSSRE